MTLHDVWLTVNDSMARNKRLSQQGGWVAVVVYRVFGVGSHRLAESRRLFQRR